MPAMKNLLVVLGPTATGKTRLGVYLADALGGEVVSVDSRQVYRGLDLGSGKDLSEYVIHGKPIPYHLIDITDLSAEYSVFDFQRDFYAVFEQLRNRGVLPVAVGGTGLYLEAALSAYRLVESPRNDRLRTELEDYTGDQLVARLASLKTLHNTTDLEDRERLIRAIEIAEYSQSHAPEPAPDIRPVVLGVYWDREVLRRRIRQRLEERLEQGLIDEVARLHESGVPWERLDRLGLEYRFIADFLQGKLRNRNDMTQQLWSAICQFAKRQDTWFRRMERRGTVIHWIPQGDPARALAAVRTGLDG